MQPLTIALGNNGIAKAFKRDFKGSSAFSLTFIDIDPITAAMRRMVRNLEFDISEMAVATYLCARDCGKPLVAIPAFVTRNFHHRAIFCRTDSNIKTPNDLEGRKVGVNRGYTVTTGVWARGILHDQYGVDLKKVTWLPTDDEHVLEYSAPPNVDYSLKGKSIEELLLSKTIEAAVGDIQSNAANIQPLISNPEQQGIDYYLRTGIFPVNHTIVIKATLVKDFPDLPKLIYSSLESSKEKYISNLEDATNLSAPDRSVVSYRQVMGDPFPFGLKANRNALETLIGFAVDQEIIRTPFAVEDLFITEL